MSAIVKLKLLSDGREPKYKHLNVDFIFCFEDTPIGAQIELSMIKQGQTVKLFVEESADQLAQLIAQAANTGSRPSVFPGTIA